MPEPADGGGVVERVRRLAAGRGPATVWVGIDGRGASGKTTLADRIAASVPDVDVVHVDDFGGPGVETWDVGRFHRQVVEPLLAGVAARYQRWGWDRDRGGPWRSIQPGRVLVVEGVSSTAAAVRAPWALRVWVDAPREVRLARAIARDGERMLPVWLERWMPSEERYVAAEHPEQRADLLVVTAPG